MPRYINNSGNPIYHNSTLFIPNQEVETYDTLDNVAFTVGSIVQNYNIVLGVNDTLIIRFNTETTWTTITLTAGAAQTAANICTDINTGYGSVVATVEGGKIRIDAPVINNTITDIFIATTGSTAAATLGLSTNNVNPVAVVCNQAFKFSQNAETYNITSSNNTFIFKVNNSLNWITVTLTTGAARTAQNICTDINLAYEQATADANKVAFAETPVILGPTYVFLVAPIYNNFQSKLYIKSTGNTALTVLGFTGDNFDPISESLYPSLVKTSDLPLYNPIISETILTFTGASTQYYYLTDSDTCKELQIIRSTIGAGLLFTCYIESTNNTPPFTLGADETFGINLQNKIISKLIITANGAGNLTIRELKG